MSAIVVDESEVAEVTRAKAAAVLTAMLKDYACRSIVERFGTVDVRWFASAEAGSKAGLADVHSRVIKSLPPDVPGFASSTGVLVLRATQPLDELPFTIARLLGHLACYVRDSDPATQRAIADWQKSTPAQIEGSGEFMVGQLSRHL